MGKSILLRPGSPEKGPFYIVLGKIPKDTKWQVLKDFVKDKVGPKEMDIYVHLHGEQKQYGWVRVIGRKAFWEIMDVFKRHRFRGQHLVACDPGYVRGLFEAPVLIVEPFLRDVSLFVRHPETNPVPGYGPHGPYGPAQCQNMNAYRPQQPGFWHIPPAHEHAYYPCMASFQHVCHGNFAAGNPGVVMPLGMTSSVVPTEAPHYVQYFYQPMPLQVPPVNGGPVIAYGSTW